MSIRMDKGYIHFAAADKRAAGSNAPSPSAASFKNRRILLMDDEEMIRELLIIS